MTSRNHFSIDTFTINLCEDIKKYFLPFTLLPSPILNILEDRYTVMIPISQPKNTRSKKEFSVNQFESK